ncbi:MAG: hypothetical protein KF762_10845 [Acidobacteria bacterium]|nr:hypothetical protein [Acidobacteriota bacterium]
MRFSLKLALLCVLLSIAVCSTTGLANPKLKLSGTVVSIDVGCAYERPYAAVTLLMQFYNSGDEPVIVLEPNHAFKTRVRFSSTFRVGEEESINGEVLTFDPYLDDPFGTATALDYDRLQDLIRLFTKASTAKDSRPSDGWQVIQPGAFREFRSLILVRNGFKFVNDSNKTPAKCDPTDYKAYPEHASFKVEYFLSFKKYKEGEHLFFALRDVWTPHGNLLVNEGDISYWTETILFHNVE